MLLFAAVGGLLVLGGRATAQIISDLPQCWQNCISNSGDFNCNDLDIACICRLSNGNFLTDVVTCARANCDNSLDTNLLITPLQLACNLAGVPIASAAIRNAENAASTASPTASSLLSHTTGSASGRSEGGSMTETTKVTLRTTDAAGSSVYIVVPVVIGQRTTSYGSSRTYTGSVPSSTSTHSSGATGKPVSSSSGDFAGAGASASSAKPSTDTASMTQASSSQGGASSTRGANTRADTTITTTAAVVNTASSTPSTKATTTVTKAHGGNGASSSTTANAAPFNVMQSSATKPERSSWLGFAVLLMAGVLWF